MLRRSAGCRPRRAVRCGARARRGRAARRRDARGAVSGMGREPGGAAREAAGRDAGVLARAARADRGARRPSGRRVAALRGGRERAVVGVQLLPRRPPEPRRAQHGSAGRRVLPAAARRARGVPGTPHGARVEGGAARRRRRLSRGDDLPRRHAAGGRERGHRHGRARRGARRGDGCGYRARLRRASASPTTQRRRAPCASSATR